MQRFSRTPCTSHGRPVFNPLPAGPGGELPGGSVLEPVSSPVPPSSPSVTSPVELQAPSTAAAAALASAPSWKFEPARRGDVAVAARIRMLVDFHPPAPAPPPDEIAAPIADGGAPPPKHDAVEEVVVTGERHEVGRVELGGGDVR